MSPRPGNFIVDISHPIIHQPRDHKALPILQFEFSISFARAQSGHGKSGNGQRIGEIKLANFGRYFQMNVSVRHYHRSKFQSDAEFFKRDRDRREALARLHDRERKFPAGQEAGFLPIYRDKVGLGQNLQQVFVLKRLNYRAEIDVGPKEKQIQDVADVNRRWRRGSGRCGRTAGSCSAGGTCR